MHSFRLSPYTLDAYQRICHNYFTPALGMLRLSELSAPDIQRFYNSLLMERGLSPKMVRNIHGVLHRALEEAMWLGMLRSNPSELCDLPKARRKEIRPMEQDKIGAFLQAIKGCKYELLYWVTLFTGLRQIVWISATTRFTSTSSFKKRKKSVANTRWLLQRIVGPGS